MPEYLLEIVEGPDAGRQIPLPGDAFEIGRDGVGVELAGDELVSRQHVRVTPNDQGASVIDLDSRNGTFVNGDEINAPAQLSPGDQLLIGVTVLELREGSGGGSGATGARRVPSGLTGLRPLPTSEPSVTAVRKVPEGLAVAERKPDYVPEDLVAGRKGGSELHPLLDMHTKSKARHAPLALLVILAIVIIIVFAIRG
jgi:pSer/pThr/pTyr-binding forkhead associated (FHA) protein